MKQQLNGVNIVDLVNICWEEQSKLFDEILGNQKKKSQFLSSVITQYLSK